MYDVSFPTATIGLSHSSSRGGEVGAMSFPHFTTMVLRFYVGVFYVRVWDHLGPYTWVFYENRTVCDETPTCPTPSVIYLVIGALASYLLPGAWCLVPGAWLWMSYFGYSNPGVVWTMRSCCECWCCIVIHMNNLRRLILRYSEWYMFKVEEGVHDNTCLAGNMCHVCRVIRWNVLRGKHLWTSLSLNKCKIQVPRGNIDLGFFSKFSG